MSDVQQQRVTWTRWNHLFDGKLDDGYAVCSNCEAREDSGAICAPCPKGPATAALARAEEENAGYVEQLRLRNERLARADALLADYSGRHNDICEVETQRSTCWCQTCTAYRAYLAERKGVDGG